MVKNQSPSISQKDEALRIMLAPPQERAQLLASSDRLAALVPRLPPEELFFTLREASPEAAIAVLTHATTNQVRFFLDMEIWSGDEIDNGAADRMLRLLYGCGMGRMEHWLKGLDHVDLVGLLGKLTTSSFADEDGMPEKDDLLGRQSFTLDGVHYLNCDEALTPVLQRVLTLLRNVDQRKYLMVLETLFSGLEPEDEEEGARLRRVRLAERGFPEFEEARRIYAPLAPEKFAALEKRDLSAPQRDTQVYTPLYPVTLARSPALLRGALDRLTPGELAGEVGAELALLTNMVIAADALDPREIDSYRLAALKVSGYLTIGSEMVLGSLGGDIDTLLAQNHLEPLFRVGASRVAAAAEKARKFLRNGWPGGDRKRLLFLEEPLAGTIGALLGRPPRAAIFAEGANILRDFETLAEVENAERAVSTAQLGWRFLAAMGSDPGSTQTEEGQWTLGEFIVTAIANAALGRGFNLAPIEREKALEAVSRFWLADTRPRRVAPALLARAVAWGVKNLDLEAGEEALLAAYLETVLAGFEAEVGNLDPAAVPDPRFVRGIMLI